MREAREKPSTFLSGRVAGEVSSKPTSPRAVGPGQGREAQHPQNACGKSREQRPPSRHHPAWGCRECQLCWWEGEWEEAAKAASR